MPFFTRRLFLLATASIVLSIVGALGLHNALAGPQAPPPGGNPPAPIHTGNQAQSKAGALSIGGTLGVTGNVFSAGFCLPSDKGACSSDWTVYCKKNDTREGCKGVKGTPTPSSGMLCGIYKRIVGADITTRIPCQAHIASDAVRRVSGSFVPTDQQQLDNACPLGFLMFDFTNERLVQTSLDFSALNNLTGGFNYTCVK